MIKQFFKFKILILSILVYFIHAFFIWIFYRDRWKRIRRLTQLVSDYARWGRFVIGIKVNWVDLDPEVFNDNYLIVSNHLSYVDIFVLGSRVPGCFVTSVEIKETPFLGQVTSLAGCLFVERRNKINIHQEIKDLTQGLKNGLNIFIFPEATSTNGETVIRFRRPLLNSAIDAKKKILPLVLNYRKIDENPIGLHNRD